MNFKKNQKTNMNLDPFSKADRRTFIQFVVDNKKLVMPLVLILAVLLTVVIALRANQRIVDEAYASIEGTTTSPLDELDVTTAPLELNEDNAIDELMKDYFTAYANGDMDAIRSMYEGLEDTEELKLREVSKYIYSVDSVKAYTKPGPFSGTWIAYVYTEVTFKGYEEALPGMQTMYICSRDDGSLYINGDVVDSRVADYISEVSLQADVVDLNNSIAATYNDMVAADDDLAAFLSTMSTDIQNSVDEALATMETGGELASAADSSEEQETGKEETAGSDETGDEPSEQGREAKSAEAAESEKVIIRSRDYVNIRTSDSETADKISRTKPGDEFEELELLPNGWSKIRYDSKTAYVKSEYFELVSGKRNETEAVSKTGEEASTAAATTAKSDTSATAKSDTAATAKSDTSATAKSDTSATAKSDTAATAKSDAAATAKSENTTVVGTKTGRMKTMDSVKFRSGLGTDKPAYGTLYPGTFVEVIENYADGWSKVEYGGKTGYIKSEYLE